MKWHIPVENVFLRKGFFSYTGYRLAFNYLKAKRLVDAIDVCHKVDLNFCMFVFSEA